MKNVEDMTPAQLRALANKIEQEEKDTIVKRGITKDILYYLSFDYGITIDTFTDHIKLERLATEEEVEVAVRKFKEVLTENKIEKGSTFQRYKDGTWVPFDGSVELEIDDDSIEQHLENIIKEK